jgi:hypothetical protein
MNARQEQLKEMSAQLVADVILYPTADGGRRTAALPGWGCPCMIKKESPFVAWDAWPLLGETPISPGESRRLGFVFLSPEGLAAMQKVGKFYLWEGRFIGEATVVNNPASAKNPAVS